MTIEVAVDCEHEGLDGDPFELGVLQSMLERLLADHHCSTAALTVVLTDDEYMAELHQRFLGIAGTTDCLSFPADEPDELGEVYLSVEVAARKATELQHSVATEIRLYAVHGVLHLLGYDDDTPEACLAMRAAEQRYSGIAGDGS